MTQLAEAIVNYRAKNRLSQKEFASRAGVSLQTICNIETGQQDPSRVTVAKIMLVLNDNKEE